MEAITPQEAFQINTSFFDAVSRNPKICTSFYEDLFALAPEVRPMFPDDMSDQTDKLALALSYVVRGLQNPAQIAQPLREMGERHERYGAEPAHYDLVGQVLLASLSHTLKQDWTEEREAAWRKAYAMLAALMLRKI